MSSTPLADAATLRLRVAQLTLTLRAERGALLRHVPAAYLPFVAQRGSDIALDLVEDPVPRPPRSALLFASGGLWRAFSFGGGLLYQFHSAACDPAFYKGVALDAGRRRGRLYFPRPRAGGPRFPLEFPLDELLFQHRLAQEGRLEIHACGVKVGGRVLAFCGASGAGKSTTARLWRRVRPDADILNDDRIVVRAGGRGTRVWGTPWHGEARLGGNTSGQLGAIFFLRQAPATRLTGVTPAEAAARLMALSFYPPWERETVARVLETCAQVALSVPCFLLEFRPEAAAVRAALAALAPRG